MGATPVQRSRIFISYRREDAQQAAGRLAADLRAYFDRDQVFEDIASIAPGADFMDALREGLASCAAVIVLIGPSWAALKDRQGRRRITLADDWVRQEVAYGLQQQEVRVFPVLVDDADMPLADDLPEDLQPLTRRQATPVTVRHWVNDVRLLADHLKRIPGLDKAPVTLAPSLANELAPLREKAPVLQMLSEPEQPAVPQAEVRGEAPNAWYWNTIAIGIPALVVIAAVFQHFSSSDKPASAPAAAPAVTPAKSASPFALGSKDCDVCPEMVVVPAGSFVMGSPAREQGRQRYEGPQHIVDIPVSFAASKFEVTFDEWDACVRERECTHNPPDAGWGRGKRPVINVSWKDAQQFVRWLSTKTRKTYRLLGEAEWEYVARAGTITSFNTGANINHTQANYDDSKKRTVTVGSYQPNAFGLYDVHGNVSEWTEDCWNDNYTGAPTDGSAWTTGDCERRAIRGGSWGVYPWAVRSAFRDARSPGIRDFNYGLRVARTL